jgi:hypothetical protein
MTRFGKHVMLLLLLILLPVRVYAAGYLDQMRELDLRLLCVIVWFAPSIVVLLFALGGLLFAAGSAENRAVGKNLMVSALLGLLLVIAFLLISWVLVPEMDLAACLTGSSTQDPVQQGSRVVIMPGDSNAIPENVETPTT